LARGEFGEFFVMTAFVQAGEWIVRIECEAPAEARVEYEPIFVRVIESFEVPGKSEPGKTQVIGEVVAQPLEATSPTESSKAESPKTEDSKAKDSPMRRPAPSYRPAAPSRSG